MLFLSTWVLMSQLVVLPDPLSSTAFAVYDRDGGCGNLDNCLDGKHARRYRDTWMPLLMRWVKDVPDDAEGLFIQARLNVTHPAADPSACYIQIMATDEPEMVDARSHGKWMLRLMSHRDSERDSQSALIPVRNGITWLRYTYRIYDEAKEYPETCSYGANLSVTGYVTD